MSTSTIRQVNARAGPSTHSGVPHSHGHGHGHNHNYRSSPRQRPRSVSRSSSSPSPPPTSAILPSATKAPRRSFSRSPGAIANRRVSKHEASPLNGMHAPPPESPLSFDEGGFSTQYGASASSPPRRSGNDIGEDWFVSARGGEETEVEAEERKQRTGVESMLGKGRQASSDALSSLVGGGPIRRNDSDVTLLDAG